MTPLEKYKRAVRAAERAAEAVRLSAESRRLQAAVRRRDAAKEELARNCPHPEEFTYEYTWEHDTGYGKQYQVTGRACRVCGKRKSWPGSDNWWKE